MWQTAERLRDARPDRSRRNLRGSGSPPPRPRSSRGNGPVRSVRARRGAPSRKRRNEARGLADDPVVHGCRVRNREPVADVAVVDRQRDRGAAANQTYRLLNSEQQVWCEPRPRSVWSIEFAGRKMRLPSVPGMRTPWRHRRVRRDAPASSPAPAVRAALTGIGASNKRVQEQLEPDADVGEPQHAVGSRGGIAPPDVARKPRRDVCAVEDEIFGFGHRCGRSHRELHQSLHRRGHEVVHRRQQIRIVGQRAREARSHRRCASECRSRSAARSRRSAACSALRPGRGRRAGAAAASASPASSRSAGRRALRAPRWPIRAPPAGTRTRARRTAAACSASGP